jgi:hypothetical protein
MDMSPSTRLLALCALFAPTALAEVGDSIWALNTARGYQTLQVMDEGERIIFDYRIEAGTFACQVPGYASRAPLHRSGEARYLFRNDPQHQRWNGQWEGYLPAPAGEFPCELELVFQGDSVTLRELGGFCRHFCGRLGSLGGTLEKHAVAP